MSDWTEGPWEVGQDDENEQGTVCSKGGGLVAVVTHECVMPRPEQDANARLIAAAPELLEACQMVADMAVSWQPLTPGDIAEVRAAISKATGKV